MSCFFCVIHNHIPTKRIEKFSSIHSSPIHKIQTDNFYFVAGGIAETCFVGSLDSTNGNSENGYCVVGIGLKRYETYCSILTNSDWKQILSSENIETELQNLDGHFAIVVWNGNEIKCFTDQLGLRTMYFSEIENGIVFSTRLDWIAQASGNNEIDFETFGSRWFLFNQLSYGSCVKGITRLGANGSATFTSNSFSMKSELWKPTFGEHNEEAFLSTLQAFVQPHIENEKTVSLGLSGGVDSRTLLSLLLSKQSKKFSVHTFGNSFHPDVIVAKIISESEKLEHVCFDEAFSAVDESVSLVREYAARNCVVEPISTAMRVRYYSQLRSQNKFVLDGGFGEIARRQYFNRLLLRGRKFLLNGNGKEIFPFLRVNRAPIFRDELLQTMKGEVEKEIESLWNQSPTIQEIGEENFLDLLAVRTRFPNFGESEQSRMDSYVENYMPFAQPSFLQTVFSLSLNQRKNGKLFRKIIREHSSSLAKLSLVKGATMYPFYFSTIPAAVFTKLKTKFGFAFRDESNVKFLFHIKEFILDTLYSNEVKTYSAYDYLFLEKSMTEFYKGKRELVNVVDWWLSFELWRQSLKKNTL
jgi:asparagine synthetase B (glutamine-hydrolysing)